MSTYTRIKLHRRNALRTNCEIMLKFILLSFECDSELLSKKPFPLATNRKCILIIFPTFVMLIFYHPPMVFHILLSHTRKGQNIIGEKRKIKLRKQSKETFENKQKMRQEAQQQQHTHTTIYLYFHYKRTAKKCRWVDRPKNTFSFNSTNVLFFANYVSV